MSRPLGGTLGHVRPFVCAACTLRSQLTQARVARHWFGVRARNGQHRSASDLSPRDGDTSVLSLLEERGYIKDIAGDRTRLDKLLRTRQVGFYAGIDPTAPSLHLGHLLPLMLLFWLYMHGHKAVSLVGGATAKVGDPSGRLTTRAKTADSVHDANFKSLYEQLGRVWDNAEKYGVKHGYTSRAGWKRELLNNASWLDHLNIVEFLRLLGHGARLGTMLGRDTVRNKMEKGDGMSFSEFTYPLLQAWDWWHMYQHHNVQVQIGGSDQYGNIVAGMDAVRYIAQTHPDGHVRQSLLDTNGRVTQDLEPMGLTVPLLTTASGEKFGKSAGNAIWLDRTLTSPFDLYGFLLRSADDAVERYLKLFTFVPTADIAAVMAQHSHDAGKRLAQHLLATEVLELVHGPEEAAKTKAEHHAMRNPSLASLSRQSDLDLGVGEAAAKRILLPQPTVVDAPLSRILREAGLVGSRSEGVRMVKSGAVYVASTTANSTSHGASSMNFMQVTDDKQFNAADSAKDGLLVLRLGKWKVRVIELMDEKGTPD